MSALFDSTAPIDPRREAQLLHEIQDMCNGDKRDAELMRNRTVAAEVAGTTVAERVEARIWLEDGVAMDSHAVY